MAPLLRRSTTRRAALRSLLLLAIARRHAAPVPARPLAGGRPAARSAICLTSATQHRSEWPRMCACARLALNAPAS